MAVKLLFVAAAPEISLAWVGLETNEGPVLHIVDSKFSAKQLLPVAPPEDLQLVLQLINNSGLPDRLPIIEARPTRSSFIKLLVPFAQALANNPTAKFPAAQEEGLLHFQLPKPTDQATPCWGIAALLLENRICHIVTLPSIPRAIELIRGLKWMSSPAKKRYYQKIEASSLSHDPNLATTKFEGTLVNRLCAALALETHQKSKATELIST